MKIELFQFCDYCWVFQICWHIDCSTLTETTFNILHSSSRIPSFPLAFFVAMLPKVKFSPVQLLVMSNSLRPHETQHPRPCCPSPTPGVHTNPCPSSRWCHPTISFSVVPFSYCRKSFPASGSFLMSQFFSSGGQVLEFSFNISRPMNTQDWSPLGWTGWISLQSKGLSRVFSNTTVQKYQFFSAQPSL